MASNCRCGTQLPDGASFCPGCGRPLRPGIGKPAERPDPRPIASGRSGESGRPSLSECLRAALPPALGAALVRLTFGALGPFLAVLSYLAPLGSGYLAVRFFEKRNRHVKSPWLGLGLGAVAGLLCFVPSLLLQLSALAAQGREGFLKVLGERADEIPFSAEILPILEQPGVFAMAIAFALMIEGLFLLATSGMGGVLAVSSGRIRAGRR